LQEAQDVLESISDDDEEFIQLRKKICIRLKKVDESKLYFLHITEVFPQIFKYLNFKDKRSLSLTCKTLNECDPFYLPTKHVTKISCFDPFLGSNELLGYSVDKDNKITGIFKEKIHEFDTGLVHFKKYLNSFIYKQQLYIYYSTGSPLSRIGRYYGCIGPEEVEIISQAKLVLNHHEIYHKGGGDLVFCENVGNHFSTPHYPPQTFFSDTEFLGIERSGKHGKRELNCMYPNGSATITYYSRKFELFCVTGNSTHFYICMKHMNSPRLIIYSLVIGRFTIEFFCYLRYSSIFTFSATDTYLLVGNYKEYEKIYFNE
jgi:hypothetical protein